MKILYGIEGKYVDVTYLCYSKLVVDGVLIIPVDDNIRAGILGDPLYRVLKHIKIGDTIYDHKTEVRMEVSPRSLADIRKEWWLSEGVSIENTIQRLERLHQYIKLDYGSIKDELPEQLMAIRYIKPNDVVLELGGNIGRNSCVIASILSDDRNLVVMESHPQHSLELVQNRKNNGFRFNIEPAALSTVPLIQKGWNTTLKTTKSVPPGYTEINTINFTELKTKYNKHFNVLVIDCEGAFYQILKTQPEVLNGIETVIIENDFIHKQHKEYVDKMFEENRLKMVYTQNLAPNDQNKRFKHTLDCFFQVFRKVLK